ncbi:MAG: right-handed parallel beta-helix repeat-containing protein [Gemmatimonadaceae bacterium]|nr:right-handed parallel beta-helix repeat-containing protein [Gemmatimonadaceae bacterium]
MPVTYKSLDSELKSTVRSTLTPRGKTIYVHANDGSDGDSGRSWTRAYQTMAKAFSVLSSGDTIYFAGKIREQLITPVQVFDVSVIGAGNRPRHADDAPTPTGGKTAATWTTPASGATTAALCKVLQQGWRFENILFAGPSDHASLWFFRDNGADDAERDASHGVVRECRFASGQDGIHVTEVANLLIEDNQFNDLTGHALKGVAGSGIANPLRGTFRRNVVEGCANGFYNSCNKWRIYDNVFDDGGTPTTTVVLNTDGDGANGANNFVFRNYFQTTTANFNSPDIVGCTTDLWVQNFSFDATSAGVGGNFEAGKPA